MKETSYRELEMMRDVWVNEANKRYLRLASAAYSLEG